MTTVAVTGASGYIGRLLLEHLGADPDVTRVLAIDIVDPDFTTRNLEFYRMDVRSPHLIDAFRGCDVVVHLAAVSDADPAEIRDVNVGGTRAVADAAVRADVRKLIFTSSGRVYGAHPDNDYPLTENSPVRPARDDVDATSKAEAESVVKYHAEAHPSTTTTILRLAWVCGPSLPTHKADAIDTKVRFAIRGYAPPFQAVHEADAARAIAFAVSGDVPGIYNVASSDWVEEPEKILGQRRMTLSLERARRVLPRAARMGMTVPASAMGTLMYPQVMSNEALLTRGFTFEHSTADALAEAAEARRDWVALGRLHFRPRRLAIVTGTLGAALVGRAVNKRFGRGAAPGGATPEKA